MLFLLWPWLWLQSRMSYLRAKKNVVGLKPVSLFVSFLSSVKKTSWGNLHMCVKFSIRTTVRGSQLYVPLVVVGRLTSYQTIIVKFCEIRVKPKTIEPWKWELYWYHVSSNSFTKEHFFKQVDGTDIVT